MNCKICNNSKIKKIYEGKIRDGKFGELTANAIPVFQCEQCELAWLDTDMYRKLISGIYYEGEEYRTDVDPGPGVENFYKAHDWEMIRPLEVMGIELFRNKKVMDIGCGAGSFLDLVSGMAENVVAVEPAEHFRRVLKKKRIENYSYTDQVPDNLHGTFDIITLFSVLEHLEEPIELLTDVSKLLNSTGEFWLSTPNLEDFQISFFGDNYKQFYFRKVHPYYYTQKTLEVIGEKLRFNNVQVKPYQRFGLDNFINWAKDGKPKGNQPIAFVSDALSRHWRSELEAQGVSDYLYVRYTK